MHRLIRIVVPFVALAAVATFLFMRSSPTDGDAFPTAPERPGADQILPAHSVSAPAPVPPAPSTAAGQVRIERALLERYQCGPSPSPGCDTNMLKASSLEEAAWLMRNGYPTLEEVEAVDSQGVDMNSLAQSAGKGSLTAMGLYGRALTSDGKFDQASRVLSQAVARGSVFATYELARVYGAADYRFRDVHESAAYVRAAYLLGDKEAGQRLYISYPNFGAMEFARADKRGYEIYMGLLKLRQQNGIGSADPRP